MAGIGARNSGHITRRAALGLFSAAAGTAALAACGPAATAPSAQQSAAAQPKPGGTLRIGVVPGLQGETPIDPHIDSTGFSDHMQTMFDHMISRELGDTVKDVPMLAESWDISSDLKQFKYNLRKGVQFHTGREFTSEDVRLNILRAKEPKALLSGYKAFADWWTSIETPDKYTLVLKSDRPRPGVHDYFERFRIGDPQIYRPIPRAELPVDKAVGTGSFRLAEYVPGDHMYLVKNKDYWQSGRPYLDEIRATFYKDAQSVILALEAGAIDVALRPSPREVARLAKDPKYTKLSNKYSGVWWQANINTVSAPTNNKLVRQALHHAIDRQRWIDQELGGLGVPRFLPHAPGTLAYDAARANFYPYDLDKARALLQKAGVADIALDLNATPGIFPELASFGQMLQADLAKIGVKLGLKFTEVQEYQQNGRDRKFGIQVYGRNGAALNEGFVFLTTYYPVSGGDTGFADPRYKQLIDAVSSEPDEAKRKGLYGQLNDLLIDEAFGAAVAGVQHDTLTTSKVHGTRYSGHENLILIDVWLDR